MCLFFLQSFLFCLGSDGTTYLASDDKMIQLKIFICSFNELIIILIIHFCVSILFHLRKNLKYETVKTSIYLDRNNVTARTTKPLIIQEDTSESTTERETDTFSEKS